MPRTTPRNPRVRSRPARAPDVRLAHKRALERAIRQERTIQRLQQALARALHASDAQLLDLRRALGKRFEFADLVEETRHTTETRLDAELTGARS